MIRAFDPSALSHLDADLSLAPSGTMTAEQTAVSNDAASYYGGRVRKRRDAVGITLDELSRRSGVSRAMLSKVERGEKSPTIGIATRIAHALQTTLSDLIGGSGPEHALAVTRKGERAVFRDPATGFERHVVSPAIGGARVELVYHHLPPGTSTGPLPPYPRGTEKQVIVEQGTVVVVMQSTEQLLSEGDALFFEADVEHAFTNHSERPCGYFLVISRRA